MRHVIALSLQITGSIVLLAMLRSLIKRPLEAWRALLQRDREIRIEMERRVEEADRVYALKKLDKVEAEWRKILAKKKLTWTDRLLIRETGIHDEKTLQEALAHARANVDVEVARIESRGFFRFLINLLGM